MWFRHPPPPDRRAVAMQMVERKAELAPETRSITVDGAGDARAPESPPLAPLDFTITYTVAEFARMLREHVVFVARRRRPKGPQRTSSILPFLVTLLAPLFYFVRQRPAGATGFRLDAAGFTRTHRLGAFSNSWDQVREVHSHPGADVLVLDKHWIPIPRRCLDRAQAALLRAYLDEWRGGHVAKREERKG